MRTCVGCRTRQPTHELARFRWSDGAIVSVDQAPAAAGRGAWLCRDTMSGCGASAARIRAFDRAFRTKVPTAAVESFLRDLTDR